MVGNLDIYVNEIKFMAAILCGDEVNVQLVNKDDYNYYYVHIGKNKEVPSFCFKYYDDLFIYLHVKLWDINDQHWNPKYTEVYEEKVIETIRFYFSV